MLTGSHRYPADPRQIRWPWAATLKGRTRVFPVRLYTHTLVTILPTAIKFSMETQVGRCLCNWTDKGWGPRPPARHFLGYLPSIPTPLMQNYQFWHGNCNTYGDIWGWACFYSRQPWPIPRGQSLSACNFGDDFLLKSTWVRPSIIKFGMPRHARN